MNVTMIQRETFFLKEFLNDDPSSLLLPLQELKVVELTNEKSSIDEPPVVELKDLPPHLEYAFLEGDDKLPVILAKDLKDEEKTALINVLKISQELVELEDRHQSQGLQVGREMERSYFYEDIFSDPDRTRNQTVHEFNSHTCRRQFEKGKLVPDG
nr:reverse transcriptase domain-containing protein [Tanacetum cinerariifolium]